MRLLLEQKACAIPFFLIDSFVFHWVVCAGFQYHVGADVLEWQKIKFFCLALSSDELAAQEHAEVEAFQEERTELLRKVYSTSIDASVFNVSGILHPDCGGRKCYVYHVNPYNKIVSAGVICKSLLLGSGSDEAPIQNDSLIWWRVIHIAKTSWLSGNSRST